MRQVEAIRRATLKADQAGFHLSSSAPPTAGIPDRTNHSPSLNNRERAADSTSARFPREATRASFDALTFGSGQADWNHLQRSPHGTLGQPGGGGEFNGLGGLGMKRTYSGEEINLDPSHPSNRERLLTPGGGRHDTFSPTTEASFRQELERDRDGFNPFSDRQSIATDTLSFGSTNVIPIAFVPPTTNATATGGDDEEQMRKDHSAMALDAARRELENMRGGQLVGGPPTRPRRSPDLDLRLNVAGSVPPPSSAARFNDVDRLEYIGRTGAVGGRDAVGGERHSYQTSRTTNSIAPSFFSSQTDLADVPMILTSRQVQVGTRQVAEVVQLSGDNSPQRDLSIDTAGTTQGQLSPCATPIARSPHSARSLNSTTSDPFDDRKFQQYQIPASSGDHGRLQHTLSQQTFGEHELDVRADTPQSRDLRFSMGSLALRPDDRDSMSSFGTGRFTDRNVAVVGEARKVFVGHVHMGGDVMQPPRPAFSNQAAGRSRESMMSGRSDADSLLGSFPIIPPSPEGQNEAFPVTHLPSSMSTRSLAVASIAASSAPPVPSVPHLRDSTHSGNSDRPSSGVTTLNNDAILSSFPPVPGPPQGMARSDSAEEALNDEVEERPSRKTMGMSVASEGLSGFDFRFEPEDDEEVPPVPSFAHRVYDNGPRDA